MGFEDLLTKNDLGAIRKIIAEEIAKQAPPESPWLNIDQAAAYCGDTKRLFWEKVQAGKIPYSRDGKPYKFYKPDLDAYMMAHRVMSEAELQRKIANKGY